MATLRAEFLDDKVRVHYTLGKPYGIKDVQDSIDIPYGSIPALKPVPQERLDSSHFDHCEEIFVPQTGSTIIFVFDSYQEKSAGPNEEDINGPYLKTAAV